MKNKKVLYVWIGTSDLDAPNKADRKGPIADFLINLAGDEISHVALFFDCDQGGEQPGNAYLGWLNDQIRLASKSAVVDLLPQYKGDPTSFNWVYDAMREAVEGYEAKEKLAERHYLVGPGTPTMAACTLVFSRLVAYAGTLWQTDRKSPQGFRRLELPFDLALQDAPDPASRRRGGDPLETRPQEIIVASPSMKHARRLTERAAQSRHSVLILGSTGSGKEVLARYLYENSHSRLKGALISVNCAAFPDNLIEAELFGYKRGAYTGAAKDTPGKFEAAQNGMLFLDEIGELPLFAQSKLLRVLQERKVVRIGEHQEREINCRIVAATHRNLWQAVVDGRFRADLYYRLAELIIELPDLAQRSEDLGQMIDRFWQRVVKENPGFPGKSLTDAARQRLLAHPWPGNVRELLATLSRVAFLAEARLVSAADVELALAKSGDKHTKTIRPQDEATGVQPLPETEVGSLKEMERRFKRQLVERALAKAGGNRTKAAHQLGITPQHLGRILKTDCSA